MDLILQGDNICRDTLQRTSAINNAAGGFLRDFAFNVGFYSDTDNSASTTTPGFVISASNNTGRANSFPNNPARNPIAITATGWYTFEHHFYNNAGVLAVDLAIMNAATNTTVSTWTLSTPADLIGLVGGNRYGWFPNSEFAALAIDNAALVTADAANAVPEPATVALFRLGLAGLALRRRKQK